MSEWKSGPRRDLPCRGCAALREERDRLRAAIDAVQGLVLDAQLGDHDRAGSDVVRVADLQRALEGVGVVSDGAEEDMF